MTIWNEIKQNFKKGSYLTQLIYINLAVFLLAQLLIVAQYLLLETQILTSFVSFLSLPALPDQILMQPWSIITYMFLHIGFLHILFNLLWLYWFGNIFLESIEEKHLLSVYLLGGISGAALFVLAYNVFPVFSSTLEYAQVYGASAAVMAVVFAAAFYWPDRLLHITLVGSIKLKYIALAVFVIDIVSISDGNAGGHIAHIGGAIWGFWFIREYKKGRLISRFFEQFLDKVFTLFKSKSKLKVHYKKTGNVDHDYLNDKKLQKDELNNILDKISKSGYDSLSKSEKENLFKNNN